MHRTWVLALACFAAATGPVAACGDGCKGEKAGEKTQQVCDDAKKQGCEGEQACDAKAKQGCEGEQVKDGATCPMNAGDKAKAGCEGGSCEGETASLSATYELLLARAKKGCEVSKEKVATLQAVAGAKCEKSTAVAISDLEAKAEKGCKESKMKLAMLRVSLMPLSKQVAFFTEGAKKGCEISKSKLAALGAACETGGCTESLMAKVTDLETKASKGCKESKALLASLRSKLIATAAPASAPKAETKAAKADCGDGSCCSTEGGAKEAGCCEGAPEGEKPTHKKPTTGKVYH